MTQKATSTIDPAAVTLAELHALYYGLPDPTPESLGEQAARTRRAIIDGTRELLVRIDYADLLVGDIAAACGISRASFYAYFKDKRDVIALLVAGSYRACLRVVELWDALPADPDEAAVAGWVREYFAFQDVHGMVNGALTVSGPTDPADRAMAQHLRLNATRALGEALRQRQAEPTASPIALGAAALAALNRAWTGLRVSNLPVDRTDMVRAVAHLLRTLIAARPAAPPAATRPVLPAEDPVVTAARELFLARGYARPTPAEIATACGVDRAELTRAGGPAALFRRVVQEALDAVMAAADDYGSLPHPCSPADAARWIENHYAVLDRHGAFLFNQSFYPATTEPQYHQQSHAGLLRAVWGLGTRLRGRQAVPTDAPDALGLAVLGMITDSWFYARGQGLPVDDRELIGVLAMAMIDLLG
jgi:AcrR family transcriptional regulator